MSGSDGYYDGSDLRTCTAQLLEDNCGDQVSDRFAACDSEMSGRIFVRPKVAGNG